MHCGGMGWPFSQSQRKRIVAITKTETIANLQERLEEMAEHLALSNEVIEVLSSRLDLTDDDVATIRHNILQQE